MGAPAVERELAEWRGVAVGWGGMAAAAEKAVFLLLAKLSSCIADPSPSLKALLQDNSLTLQDFLPSPFYSLHPLLGPPSSLNWKLWW
jgi:hypothetical protein